MSRHGVAGKLTPGTVTPGTVTAGLVVAALAGCTPAPAQNIVGSYFPSWLTCAVAGSIATLVLRQLLVIGGIERHLLVPPLTYAGMALGLTLLFWLLWSGL